MKTTHFLFLTLISIFFACATNSSTNFKKLMIQNPTTQADKDKNIILQHLIDKKLNYKSTASGIYYNIDNAGNQDRPALTDVVKVHYKGTLLDGKEFDSSYSRNQPAQFPLTNLIKGWQEVIPMLGVGGKGTFLIPSGLAYGERATGSIPANAVLQFEIELLDFSNAQRQAKTDAKLIEDYVKAKNLQTQVTTNGIHYVLEKQGTGKNPDINSKVKVHYEGYLLNGDVFDSSYKRGQPIEFPLKGVIKGWQEAIPVLKEGGKGKFIIPSGLAYGARGAGDVIGPNTVLIFDVELLEVK